MNINSNHELALPLQKTWERKEIKGTREILYNTFWCWLEPSSSSDSKVADQGETPVIPCSSDQTCDLSHNIQDDVAYMVVVQAE